MFTAVLGSECDYVARMFSLDRDELLISRFVMSV